jgi:hypothetical protein
MSENNDQTTPGRPEFDFSRYPLNTLFHERRNGRDRRDKIADPAEPKVPSTDADEPSAEDARPERRARKDRRRRIDPTTFDKQYTDDEMEFMNAMQRFKELSGKAFPTHGEVIKVAVGLGYRLQIVDPDLTQYPPPGDDSALSVEAPCPRSSACAENVGDVAD